MEKQIELPIVEPHAYEPCWVEGLDNESYHQKKSHVSSTGLVELLRSERHFYERHILGNRPAPTPAMRMGSLIHAAVLEPERYANDIIMQPVFNLRTNQGKKEQQEWQANLDTKCIIVSQDERELILRILESISSRPALLGMIQSAKKEVSGFFKDPATDVMCRIRPDAYLAEDGLVLDLKTTADASMPEFRRSIERYRYDLSAAFYLHGASVIEGRPIEAFRWVAIEKTPPYEIAMYDADMAWLGTGEIDYKKALRKLKNCLDTRIWPGYQTGAEYISPSNYFMQKYEFDLAMEAQDGN